MTTTHIPSYPKVWTLGSPPVQDIFDGPVVIQEKVDGSQFSFGSIDGKLVMRSKGREIFPETVDKLFQGATETAQRLFSTLDSWYNNWIFRGEVLAKPKHNTLEYSRVPSGNIILFDAHDLNGRYMTPEQLAGAADFLALEAVPTLFEGVWTRDPGAVLTLIRESVLGGSSMEGVVIKNYNKYGTDGKILTAKVVRNEFKEAHRGQWKVSNPTRKDVVVGIADSLRTLPRFRKAVQHLRDAGKLTGTPEDIGPLLKELKNDTQEEHEAQIKQILFDHFWGDIQRMTTRGFPEWYKRFLIDPEASLDMEKSNAQEEN